MDFFWAYIWPLIIIVAQSVMLLVILLVAIAYVLLADRKIWASVRTHRREGHGVGLRHHAAGFVEPGRELDDWVVGEVVLVHRRRTGCLREVPTSPSTTLERWLPRARSSFEPRFRGRGAVRSSSANRGLLRGR